MAVKRVLPAPMGRAYRMRKRSNHVTIVVAARPKPSKGSQKPARKKAEAAEAPAKPKKSEAAETPAKAKKADAQATK
jgi:large subunit ribosomal protein L22